MKYYLVITLLIIGSVSFVSCKKEVSKKNMTVIKNCTGTYLQFKEKYYKVCITDLTDSFNNNDEVNASFTKIEECKAFEDLIICALAFEFEDIIDVTKIE